MTLLQTEFHFFSKLSDSLVGQHSKGATWQVNKDDIILHWDLNIVVISIICTIMGSAAARAAYFCLHLESGNRAQPTADSRSAYCIRKPRPRRHGFQLKQLRSLCHALVVTMVTACLPRLHVHVCVRALSRKSQTAAMKRKENRTLFILTLSRKAGRIWSEL